MFNRFSVDFFVVLQNVQVWFIQQCKNHLTEGFHLSEKAQMVILNMGGILFNLKTNEKRCTLLTEHSIIGDDTF